MRVLIVNTSEKTGGAAIAANRLKEALIDNGIKAKMLVRDKTTEDFTIIPLPKSWKLKARFVWERFVIFAANHFHKHRLFEVDLANTGTDITSLREFQEADVIHLHWVNQGFLSLKDIKRIVGSGKSVVWTLHDMWNFTGICHYNGDCERYQEGCGKCPILYKGGSLHDISSKVFCKKKTLYANSHIAFVTCSHWLADLASKSLLLRGQRIQAIPNPISTNIYLKKDKREARLYCHLPNDRKLLLFTAYKTTSKIKGIQYLQESCHKLVEKYPEWKTSLAIVAVGKESEQMAEDFPIPVYPIPYVTDERRMASLYNAADLFVIPSLQDNLPNTIVEAMACSLPCVGFNVGGIPEMIDHKTNGYVARYKDADDLAEGIHFVLSSPDYAKLSENAGRKMRATYSEHAVAMQYIDVYNQITHSTNG